MNKEKVKAILLKSLIKESVDLERLHQNVSSRTGIGEAWTKMIYGLERLLEEVNEFENQFVVMNKPQVDISKAKQESRQVLASCVRMMKTIEQMDKVQQRDMMS